MAWRLTARRPMIGNGSLFGSGFTLQAAAACRPIKTIAQVIAANARTQLVDWTREELQDRKDQVPDERGIAKTCRGCC